MVVKAILLFTKCIISEHSQEKILHAKLCCTPFSLKFVFSCIIMHAKGCFLKTLGDIKDRRVYIVKRKPDFFSRNARNVETN